MCSKTIWKTSIKYILWGIQIQLLRKNFEIPNFLLLGLFISTLSFLSFTSSYTRLCYSRCCFSSGKINLLTLIISLFIFIKKIFTIILLICLIKRIRELTTLNQPIVPLTKVRRLSNEITYYPIQTSPSVK
jgi:hypothetical protein